MYKLLKILIILALLIPIKIYSMGDSDIRFSRLESYSYTSPKAIVKDKYGFLWIGTHDGLYKYDGYSYKKYINKSKNPTSISNGTIRSLLLDSSGQLWIATTNGLNKYNYSSDNFHIYKFETQTGNFIYEIFETSDKNIWVATKNGIKRLEAGGQKFQTYLSYVDHSGNVKEVGEARTFFQDIDNSLWVGTIDSGILRYDFAKKLLIQLPTKLKLETIVGISEYSENYLLVGSNISGIHIINKRDGSDNVQKIINLPIPNVKINDIITDSDGVHWIGTQNSGLLILNDQRLTQLTNDSSDNRSLPDNEIKNIYEDKDKTIWISSINEISIHIPATKSISNYYVSDNINGLSSANVYAITEDKKGNIYFGTRGSGIDIVNSVTGAITNIKLKDENHIEISPNASALLFYDDVLWVGTSKGLIYSTDLEEFHLVKLSDKDKDKDSDTIMSLKAISKNIFLVGTLTNLYLLNSKTLKIEEVNPLSKKGGWEISNAESNSAWVTATYDGLFKVSNYGEVLDFIDINELNDARVLSSLSISNKYLWIGFFDAGLSLYDLETRKVITTLSEVDGLPGNTIFTINADAKGNLWVSTQQGIAQIDVKTLNIKVLNELDGLQSKEFNLGSFYKDKFGKFYYGGTSGVSAFYPQRLVNRYPIPEVLWTKTLRVVNGDWTAFYSDPGVGSVSLFDASTIAMEYFDEIQLEFSTTELIKSKNVVYKSRLAGGNENDTWKKSNSDSRRENFSRLPPGNYSFEVKASINGYDWSDPLTLNVYKASPPWQTWWAYVLYTLLLILLISFLMRKQLKKNIEKQKIQKLIADSEERLKLALWGSRDELWDWNLASGKIHRSNTWGLINFPKRETDDNGNNTVFRNVHPKDLAVVRAALEDHKNGYTSHYEATYRVRDINDNWVWILDRGKVVEHDTDGRPLRMSGTIRNISDIKDTQEQYDLIAKAFENTSDAVFILDNEFKYQAANRAYEKITGFNAEDKKERQFSITSDNKLQTEMLQQIRQSLILDGSWQGELDDTRGSGEQYKIELKLDSVKDRLDEVTHYIGVFSDITFRKKAEEDLRRLANYDQLTGLPNRSLFQDRLKHAISLCERLNKNLILLFIDLDNFKVVNDSLGHTVGDKLLSKVAERISACVRGNDTVARLGGDEYTILLEQVDGEFVGTKVADKVLEALSRPFRIQGHELVIGCSIGIASYPDDGADVEALLRNADTAMYSAKYKDKNNYQFFTDSMNKKANTRLEMEHELRKAIPAGEIKVFYQPKVSIQSGEIIGCEALARWKHHEFGHVGPDVFIPLAEETGLIYALGEHVLATACRETRHWMSDYNFEGRTAVNLSTMQFRQSDLLDIVDNVLIKSKLPAASLELEITEGMLAKNPDQAIQIMKDLRAKEIHLSIDDFGTGYASLAQLKRFPINTLKIDKAFIDDIAVDAQDANLVRAILSLSENLNLDTVAEGVETFEQLDILSSMGCDVIQGYVYSKPISAEDFARLLSKRITLEDIKNQEKNKILNFPA